MSIKFQKNWGQIKGGKIRIKLIKNRTEYFNQLHKAAMKKARIVTHITKWSTSTKLGKQVKNLRQNPLPLIAIMLLTDGHVYKKGNCYEIGFYSKDSNLIKLFIDLIKIWKEEIILSSYVDKNKVLRLYFHLPIRNELIKLTPSFKTSPRKQSIKNYLNEKQPTINFLNKLNKTYKKTALRLALTTDGGIRNKATGRGKIYPSLFLRCAHPKLCNEWLTLSKNFGFNFKLEKDRTKWSGTGGIVTGDKKSLQNFLKIGGFVEGVKVSNKSRYFTGLEKNWLLYQYLNDKNKIKNIIDQAPVA